MSGIPDTDTPATEYRTGSGVNRVERCGLPSGYTAGIAFAVRATAHAAPGRSRSGCRGDRYVTQNAKRFSTSYCLIGVAYISRYSSRGSEEGIRS